MSRYDSINFDYPIPSEITDNIIIHVDLNHLDYQTKDFDGGYFENYKIDQDGLLYKCHDKFDDAYAIPKWYFCANYSGQFKLYAYFYGNPYVLEKSYIEFQCRVVNGKLVDLSLERFSYNLTKDKTR